MSLYALEAGKGRETVVLIHGFAGSHAAWREVQPLLAGKYRTIAYDMPGHAASLDWPGAGPAKVAARAEDLLARPEIAFVDVRSARNNCFQARIRRDV